MTIETLDLLKKWEDARLKLQKKIKMFHGQPPLPASGLHVDTKKVAEQFEKHTDAEGHPPLRGALDD